MELGAERLWDEPAVTSMAAREKKHGSILKSSTFWKVKNNSVFDL